MALRGADLRVTRPRLAVMAALERRPHAETTRSSSSSGSSIRDVSHQAVYDVLAALTAAGLVRRIQPLGSVARYEARVGDNHHHVVCRSLRRGRRRRLRGRRHAPCLTRSTITLTDRRGGGHLLGRLPRLPGAARPMGRASRRTQNPKGVPCPTWPITATPSKARSTTRAPPQCPVAHGLTDPLQGDANRSWWPHRLNLKVLAKNPAVANPLGGRLRLRGGVQEP